MSPLIIIFKITLAFLPYNLKHLYRFLFVGKINQIQFISGHLTDAGINSLSMPDTTAWYVPSLPAIRVISHSKQKLSLSIINQ